MNAISIRNFIGSAAISGVLFAAASSAPLAANADASQWGETLPALQIQVDSTRNRVWVLNVEGIYLYDSAARKLVKRIELTDWVVVGEAHSCAPALTLTPSGSALVSSNVLPVVWEIDAASLAVRKIELALNADKDRDVGFTSLAYGRGGRDLIGVSTTARSAWRIDLASGTAQKLRLTKPISRACGSALRS